MRRKGSQKGSTCSQGARLLSLLFIVSELLGCRVRGLEVKVDPKMGLLPLMSARSLPSACQDSEVSAAGS